MTDARNTQTLPPASLASFLSRAHTLAAADALLTAVLIGGAVILVVLQWSKSEHQAWIGALGVILALLSWFVLQPESQVTSCLVSSRKCVLDSEITGQECVQQRKTCLRKQLLY